jgi:hypothetical protein
MAKAPTTAAAFDGSGQVWFKILDLGPTFAADGTSTWPLYRTFSSHRFLRPLILFIMTNSSTNLPKMPQLTPHPRDIHLHHPPRSPKRRLPPAHPTTRNPQPLPSRNSPILHRMCTNHRNRRRLRNPWPACVNPWFHYWY